MEKEESIELEKNRDIVEFLGKNNKHRPGLVIGFAAGEIPKPPLNLALLKSCQIVGVFWGAWTAMFPKENQKNFEELFELLEAGKINPRIKDKFKLEDSAKAIAHLAERKATGKVIVEIA